MSKTETVTVITYKVLGPTGEPLRVVHKDLVAAWSDGAFFILQDANGNKQFIAAEFIAQVSMVTQEVAPEDDGGFAMDAPESQEQAPEVVGVDGIER